MPEGKEEGEAVGRGSGVPTSHCNPDTLSAYLLHTDESPCYFLCKERVPATDEMFESD